MDFKEGMTSFCLNRGVTGSGNQSGGLHTPPPGLKIQSNPNISHDHTKLRLPSSTVSSFQVEYSSSSSLPRGIDTGGGGGVGGGRGGSVVHGGTPGSGSDSGVKKKRGRPRKYAPDESRMELALTSVPLRGSISPNPKKNRGRPPGSGWKQRLANVGEWMNNSAGLAFTPHTIHVSAGEDVAEKILTFALQRPRAICVLSGNGSVSAVTLSQFTSSGGTVTYEGRFEILCLSGCYLVSEHGGTQNRTGGLSISVCSGDGNVIGGAIGGRLVASSTVQVVLCTFIHGIGNNIKTKTKTEARLMDEKCTGIQLNETSPVAIPWQRTGLRNSPTEIDLTRG